MNEIKAIVLVVAMVFGGMAVAAPQGSSLLCGRLSVARADETLRKELDRYRLKAYEYTDGTNTFGGLLYSPRVGGSRRFPLIVYFPGCGERGSLKRQFRQRLIFERVTSAAFQKKHPCHLLALSPPQTASTMWGGMPGRPNEIQRLAHDFVMAICKASKVGVDTDCLYITGFSYGGSGAYALSLHYPGEFAAVVPISSLPPLPEYFDAKHPGNWWHVYNEGDYAKREIVPTDIRTFCRRTNEAGGDFRIVSYPDEEHDAWTRTWNGEQIWDWMFSKSLAGERGRVGATVKNERRMINLTGTRCTASVPGGNATCGPDRMLDGMDETAYRPQRAFTRKDWMRVDFATPVSGQVEIISGETNGTKRLVNAIVEVSSNGRIWNRAGSFSPKYGTCRFQRTNKFAYLRIRPLGDTTPPFVMRRLTVSTEK